MNVLLAHTGNRRIPHRELACPFRNMPADARTARKRDFRLRAIPPRDGAGQQIEAQKARDKSRIRFVKNPPWCALRFDAPLIHDDDMFGQAEGFRLIMRHIDCGEAKLLLLLGAFAIMRATKTSIVQS